MSPSNTAFFFIPGGFCPGQYFHKVVTLLEAKGYHARALDLPSMDDSLREQGKMPGMYDDAKYVRDIVSSALDQGRDVILIGSSYGGAVTFEVCKGITAEERKEQGSGGELKHLILLGSLLAEAGPTVKELVGANIPVDIEKEMPGAATHIPPMEPAMAGYLFCGALPKGEQEGYSAMLKPISAKAFMQPLTFAAWEKVPSTLIIGDNDICLLPERQHEYFDKAVKKGVEGLRKVVIEGGDHLTMLSYPEEVVRVCLEAAGDST